MRNQKKTSKSKEILSKRNKAGVSILTDSKIYYKAKVTDLYVIGIKTDIERNAAE